MTSATPGPQENRALIGRAREFEQLSGDLQRALAGQGAMALLSGEAGIGKTYLVESLCDEAQRRGARVFAGYCYNLDAAPPYGPWRDILNDRRLRDDMPSAPALLAEHAAGRSAQSQATLFSEVSQLLAHLTLDRPVMLILEDLHWSDTASIDLLRFVARQAREHRMLTVATYRNDELTRDHPLYQRIPLLVRETQARRIELQRLDIAATAEYVLAHCPLPHDEHQRLARHLQERAQGNPFYIRELLYALEEQGVLTETASGWHFAGVATSTAVHPVPELVRQVIESRLDRLSPETRQCLEVAAVIGQDVSPDLWRRVHGCDDDELIETTRRAIESRFLRESADGMTLQFSHALVRDALYAGVVLPQRRLLHARCAELLAAQPAPEPDIVAHHFALAHDARGVEWLTRAGEHALGVYAPETAIAHLSRAIEIARALAIEPPALTARLRGLAYATIGDFNRARTDYMRALDAAQRDGDRELEWRTTIDLGALWSERDFNRTRELYNQALDLARQIGDETTIAHSLNRVGNWHLNNDQPAEAIQRCEEALGIFRRTSDTRGVAMTQRLLGMNYLVRGDLIQSDQHFREAAEGFQGLDDRLGLVSALAGHIYTAGTYTFHTEIPGPLDRIELEDMGARAVQLAVDTGWRAGEAHVFCALASSHGIRGRYAQAFDCVHRALTVAGEIDHREWMALAHEILGRLYLDLFAIPEAEQHLLESQRLSERAGAPIHLRLATAYLAYVHMGNRDVERARQTLDQLLEDGHQEDTVIARKCWAARASLAIGANDPDVALSITDRLLATTLNHTEEKIVPLYGRLRGEALTQLGYFPEAEQQLLAAHDASTACGYRPMEWRISAALGYLYRDWEREAEADDWFSRARAVVDELAGVISDGALRATYLAQARVRIPKSRDLTPLQSAKQEYGGLTARQREVAALVALGNTNADIAYILSISERTVEGHVAGVLATLNFSARTQIAAWAVTRGLLDP